MQPEILGEDLVLVEATEVSKRRELVNVRNLLIASVVVFVLAGVWELIAAHSKHIIVFCIVISMSSFRVWSNHDSPRFSLALRAGLLLFTCYFAVKYGSLLSHPGWVLFAIGLGMNAMAHFRLCRLNGDFKFLPGARGYGAPEELPSRRRASP